MDLETALEDIDLSTVKARSVSGVVTLISRSFFIQGISLVGFLALTVFLGRPEIGLFIAVSDMVSILGYFSDIGLAASLIQKKDKVSLIDLRTTFTLQQILVIISVGVMLIFSRQLFGYYNIGEGGTWLFYSLLGAFFLASLKTIPSVILERRLRFEMLAVVEIAETVVFYTIAVALAWQGMGVLSYAWAIAARAILGTAILYLIAPWKVGISFSINSIKTLMSFGVPYQINSLMAVVKDRFLNVALWKIIGADGVGIIGWAQTWSQKPLRFVMDNVTKVTFPAYSRLQEHPEELKSSLEKSLFFVTALTFPAVAGMALFVPWVVRLFPQYHKWELALLPLALYCFNSALASVSTTLTNTLNAIGKVKINTYLMIMWTALTWILTPALAIKYGFLGVSYAVALISLTSIIPVFLVMRYIRFSISSSFAKPAAATIIMILFAWGTGKVLPHSFPTLIISGIISSLLYGFVLYILVGPSLIADFRKLFNAFRKN